MTSWLYCLSSHKWGETPQVLQNKGDMFPSAPGHEAFLLTTPLEFCILKQCWPQTLIFVFHVVLLPITMLPRRHRKLQPDAINVVCAFSKRCEVMCKNKSIGPRGKGCRDAEGTHAWRQRRILCIKATQFVLSSNRRSVRIYRATGPGFVFTQRWRLQTHCRPAAALLRPEQEDEARDQQARGIMPRVRRLCDLHSLTWSSTARCIWTAQGT